MPKSGMGIECSRCDNLGKFLTSFFFSYFWTKTYVVGTHWKPLAEALLTSTHIFVEK